jgi:iron(III) transport system permease protein
MSQSFALRSLPRRASAALSLKLCVLALLLLLIAAPLAKIFGDTLSPSAIDAWTDVLASNLSRNLL